jgi:hypothetical protein
MSITNQTASPSTNNFTAIFNAAEVEYQKITGKRLDTHPLVVKFDDCRSPKDISNVLRMQVQSFGNFRQGDEKLMKWLEPMINILLTFSDTLGEGISLASCLVRFVWLLIPSSQPFSPAKTIFTGIAVLLGVSFLSALSFIRVIYNS